MERNILEAAMMRIASHHLKNELLLRGSFLTSHWVEAGVRKCDDLDFLALSPLPETEDLKAIFDRFYRSFRSALSQTINDGVTFFSDRMESEIIFEESPSPGLRLRVPFRFENKSVASCSVLQIDLGFNDPLPEPQPTLTFQFATGAIDFPSVTPELAFGWKLHGLVEWEGLVWRAKDLADLWLLQDRFSFAPTKLKSAIGIAFESRDAPLWRLDRLLQRQLGKTSGSKRRYSRFLAEFTNRGHGYPDELSELIEDVAQVVRPAIEQLKEEYRQRTGHPYPDPFIPPLKNLAKLLESQRRIRVLGLDDSHFAKVKGSVVNVAGVVCIDTRFEGMLWSELSQDGLDATDRICQMVVGSKFAPLLHLVLTDGISFGGSNIIELPVLAEQFQIPVVAVMRKYPNLKHFQHILSQLSESEERWRRVRAAGPIHQIDGWVFQCVGEDPAIIAKTLTRLTDHGKVPEALRLAHLIGSAFKFGESTKRA